MTPQCYRRCRTGRPGSSVYRVRSLRARPSSCCSPCETASRRVSFDTVHRTSPRCELSKRLWTPASQYASSWLRAQPAAAVRHWAIHPADSSEKPAALKSRSRSVISSSRSGSTRCSSARSGHHHPARPQLRSSRRSSTGVGEAAGRATGVRRRETVTLRGAAAAAADGPPSPGSPGSRLWTRAPPTDSRRQRRVVGGVDGGGGSPHLEARGAGAQMLADDDGGGGGKKRGSTVRARRRARRLCWASAARAARRRWSSCRRSSRAFALQEMATQLDAVAAASALARVVGMAAATATAMVRWPTRRSGRSGVGGGRGAARAARLAARRRRGAADDGRGYSSVYRRLQGVAWCYLSRLGRSQQRSASSKGDRGARRLDGKAGALGPWRAARPTLRTGTRRAAQSHGHVGGEQRPALGP